LSHKKIRYFLSAYAQLQSDSFRGGKTMKKIVLFLIILALLVLVSMTGLARAQVKLYEFQPIPKRVFVTSRAYSGVLGGVAGADQICQQLASEAGLSGTYKAWLAMGVPGRETTPLTTFKRYPRPYQQRNGVTVANNLDTIFTTGKLLNQIYIDEQGRSVLIGYSTKRVWTGFYPASTSADGSIVWAAADPWHTCWNWTVYSGTSGHGGTIYANPTTEIGYKWTNDFNIPCAKVYSATAQIPEHAHLYCFEQ
jgi:hypothetical protein